jgi:hypothetical protein
MPSPGTPEDPRSGRDRRVVTKRRTFKHGTLDPVSEHRRPLFTWGNAILVIIMIGFALYATGNLPQLDAFFDHLNDVGRSHNNAVVGAIITYGPYLFGAVVLAVVALFVFLFINSSRRQHSDPKGWHKVADAPPERRRISRRLQDLPSMVMPIGKTRPGAKANLATPATPPTVPQTATPIARTPTPVAATAIATPSPDPIKAAAIAAAAKAEAALQTNPVDLPSFVRPLGKTAPPASPAPPAAAPQDNAAAATAKLEATLAAAKAATAKAEAAIATAKAEAALAAAKLQAAEAEAALAAAKANAITSGS